MYEVPCDECDRVYIGETGRPIGERIKEHQRDVRLSRVDGSAVAEHAWGAGHRPNWNGVRCIDHEPHWYTRRIKEAIHIRLRANNVNQDNGVDIPGFWLPPSVATTADPPRAGPLRDARAARQTAQSPLRRPQAGTQDLAKRV